MSTVCNYYNNSFLTQKGILKDSDEEKSICDKFFDGKNLNSMIKNNNPKTWSFDDVTYALKSCNSNASGHKTFYLFIKQI